jgi:tripartite-type tricarboxylate transporter receptor subunit TctC
MNAITRRRAATLTACLPFLLVARARAADYPTHPVRIIIGFGAGSAADTPARLLAQKFSDALGQQFIVENKPGAGSNVAAEYVTRAPNDGYTLFMATTAQTTYAGMTINPTYDLTKDFAPIVRVAAVSNMLVANPSLGVTNLKELIALAKQKPNQIFFASSGVGTIAHVAGELLNIMAGIKLVHVPYPGSAQAMTDAVSGRVQLWIAPASAAAPQVEAGTLKAIAVTTAQRSSIAPNVPTIAESGLPGYDLGLWFGLLAPAGTPKPIIDKLAQLTNDALKTPDLTEPLHKIGMDTVGGRPEEFSTYIAAEVKKATDVAIAANIRQ